MSFNESRLYLSSTERIILSFLLVEGKQDGDDGMLVHFSFYLLSAFSNASLIFSTLWKPAKVATFSPSDENTAYVG